MKCVSSNLRETTYLLCHSLQNSSAVLYCSSLTSWQALPEIKSSSSQQYRLENLNDNSSWITYFHACHVVQAFSCSWKVNMRRIRFFHISCPQGLLWFYAPSSIVTWRRAARLTKLLFFIPIAAVSESRNIPNNKQAQVDTWLRPNSCYQSSRLNILGANWNANRKNCTCYVKILYFLSRNSNYAVAFSTNGSFFMLTMWSGVLFMCQCNGDWPFHQNKNKYLLLMQQMNRYRWIDVEFQVL